MHRSGVRRGGRLAAAVGGLAAAVALGGLTLVIPGPVLAAPVATVGVAAAGVDGVAAGNSAIASVDLAGTWSFTPGRVGGRRRSRCPVAAGTSRASPT